MPSAALPSPLIPQAHTTNDDHLLEAAVRGDAEGVHRALILGADVNATNEAGRCAVSLAIAGEKTADASDASFMTQSRLNTIRILVGHPHISLHALNAPEDAMDGVTPLGVASWLNAPDVVRILLEVGAGAVSVNGLDTHRATPLMYAARDGRLEVVKQLLAYGARPDYRDNNSHTSIWFALQHPQVLWLCENAVRRHRTLECQAGNKHNLSSPARLAIDSLLSDDMGCPIPKTIFAQSDANAPLINAIVSADLHLLRTLLFPSITSTSPPILVNAPDSNGWSPIHYCASSSLPSTEVLDTLYRAGADVGLFSKSGNSTPLHCLARKKRGTNVLRGPAVARELYEFVVHLCRDLNAPMRACAAGGETCLHVAAEVGDSVEVLRALLECDVDGVREMRNERGLTPLEVAKPEFRSVFGNQAETTRSSSPASFRTVRPSHFQFQSPSPTTPTAHSLALPSPCPTAASLPRISTPTPSPAQFNSHTSSETSSSSSAEDTAASATHLIDSLRLISNELSSPQHPLISDLDRLSALLRTTSVRSGHLLTQLRTRIDEASDELRLEQEQWRSVDGLLDGVSQAYEDKVKEEKRVTDEESSEGHGLELDDFPLPPVSATGETWVGRARSGTTVSAESQMTAVDSIDSYSTGPPLTPTSPHTPSHPDDEDQRSFFHFDGDDRDHSPGRSRRSSPGEDDGDDLTAPLKVPWPAWIDRSESRRPHASYGYNTHFVPSKTSPNKSPSTTRSNTPNSSHHNPHGFAGTLAAALTGSHHGSKGSEPQLKTYKSMGELRNRPKHLSLTRTGNSPTPSSHRGSPIPHTPASARPSQEPVMSRPNATRPRAETSASVRSVKFPVTLEVPTVKSRSRAGSLFSVATGDAGSGVAVAGVKGPETTAATATDGSSVAQAGKGRARSKSEGEKSKAFRHLHHSHSPQEGEKTAGQKGTGKFKAWFRKTLNLKPLTLTPVAEDQQHQYCGQEPQQRQQYQQHYRHRHHGKVVPVQEGCVSEGEGEAEGRSSLTTLCEREDASASGKRRSLSGRFPYRAFAAASKDLARMDERMSNAEKILASAYRRVAQAERIIQNALQTRERTIQEFQAANSVDAGLEAFLSHRDSRSHSPSLLDSTPYEFVDFPTIPSPASPSFSGNDLSAHSSVSSLALGTVLGAGVVSGRGSEDSDCEGVERRMDGNEDDTKGLYALLTRKVDVRIDGAMEEVEKVRVWLGVVKGVVKGVQKRVGLEVPKGLAL